MTHNLNKQFLASTHWQKHDNVNMDFLFVLNVNWKFLQKEKTARDNNQKGGSNAESNPSLFKEFFGNTGFYILRNFAG
jgi:hypothetical protein